MEQVFTEEEAETLGLLHYVTTKGKLISGAFFRNVWRKALVLQVEDAEEDGVKHTLLRLRELGWGIVDWECEKKDERGNRTWGTPLEVAAQSDLRNLSLGQLLKHAQRAPLRSTCRAPAFPQESTETGTAGGPTVR